jgi:hypothetical protein
MKRIVVVALFLCLACKKEERVSADPASVHAFAVSTAAVTATAATGTAATTTSPTAQPASRMIIRNANLSLVVRDAIDVLRRTTALVESKGGYVAEERQWKEREQFRGSATLRVPAPELTTVLASIRSLGVRVESEAITGQDVSQEFSDSAAQLRNLQATETELRELLRTIRERSQKASEVMAVYDELTKVRGDIERIQGRMQYLSQMTALSTITLDLVPDALAAPVVEPGWQPWATTREAARSLVNTLKSLADAAIWFVLYLLPIALIFVVVTLALRALWRRLRRYDRASSAG